MLQKGFFENSEDKDFDSDSFVTDITSKPFFSQAYTSVSFLNYAQRT